MARAARTWKTYRALLSELAAMAGETLEVRVRPTPREEELLTAFQVALKGGELGAASLLEGLNISPNQFTYHLRYIARWGVDRRRLLADGANFQLLEGRNAEDREGKLAGLVLRGTKIEQERALADHLREFAPQVEGHGWLDPRPNPGKPVREYGQDELAWVYSPSELQQADDLHSSVARSLIRRYLPKPGIVADPMAGSGTIARMAQLLGHRVWASDLRPRAAFIAQFDLHEGRLEEVLGEQYAHSADLVVVHPPSAQDLNMEPHKYLDWLTDVLRNSWNAVSRGGHVALVVSIDQPVPLLSRAERALLDSAKEAFEGEGMMEEVEGLTAQHLAVAQGGRQGWYILVLRRPTLASDAEA